MGTTDHRGAPRNLKEHHGTPIKGMFDLKPATFSRFSHFRPSRFAPVLLPSPITNVSLVYQRFVGVETPGIGWVVEYRSEEQGQSAQRTAAELGGSPRNRGPQERNHSGPPRRLAERGETLRRTNRRRFPRESTFFRTLGSLGPLVPHCPHPAIPNFSVVSKRLVLAGRPNIGAMRRPMGIWAKWATAEPGGTPRILAGPHGTSIGGSCALQSTFLGDFRASGPIAFACPLPFPNYQRFGSFETPGIGRGVEYWRGE